MRGTDTLRRATCVGPARPGHCWGTAASKRRRSPSRATHIAWHALPLILMLSGQVPTQAQHRPYKTLLRNGITVITKEVHTSHVVAVSAFMRGGASLDPPEMPGLANFVQNMLLRGTTRRTGEQVRAPIEAMGGTLDGRTESDNSLLFTLSSADGLDAALDVLADVLRRPRFDPAEIEKERQQILAALAELESEPEWIVQQSLQQLLYPSGPYGHAILGTQESVKRIQRADLVSFHRRYYSPENLIVVVVGNMDRAAAEARVAKVFADWPRSGRPSVNLPTASTGERLEGRPRLVVKEKPGPYAHMGIAFPMGALRREEYPAIVVMHALLGGGMGSRLVQEARERYGLAYRVSVTYSHHAGDNHFGVFLSLDPFRPVFGLEGPSEMVVNKAKDAILEQFDWLRENLVSNQELNRARNFAAGSFAIDHQRTLHQARSLGWFELVGLGYQYDEELPSAIDRVTQEDLQNLAQKYFARYALALVMPEPPKE